MADKSERALKEEKILQFWKDNNIFEKSLEKESPKGEFVFYEGPPTANGRPAIHHVEARSFKDAVPRYRTMRGYRVRRKGGWDTHGLPVELEVEKTLGLKSKKEIEAYGVAKFNEECKKSVWKYIDEWRDLTHRMGYWVDIDNPYVTYHNSYIESVWSVIAKADDRQLLYKDYKVVPWCPRCGTGLSSHELAQGYADVKDLSVYAKFKIVGFDKAYFLAWTTTPWTLPGNVALAVGENIDYVEAKVGEEIYVLAKERLSLITEPYEIIAEHKGSEMVGMEYEPLYPFLKDNYKGEGLEKAYKVYAADFVNTEDGTGIVHTAVMYGQDDFVLGSKIGLPKYHLVDETGHFTKETGFLSDRFVKEEETAVEIIKDLAHRGLLFKKEKYEHSYPHCWRCKTPLIYYARDSWYIRMSELRDELVSENQKINWEPSYIKDGRFGEWLREVKDWAISRERYWGTPLPVWHNKDGSKKIVADSLETLKQYGKSSGNKYFVMRHGGTESNIAGITSYAKESDDHLTEEGRLEIARSAKNLKDIDLIISSPFTRTRESAEIVRKTLGLKEDVVVFDERLREVNPGELDGKSWSEYHKNMSSVSSGWFDERIPGGETLREVGERVARTLYDLEEKYKGKNILIMTHGGAAWLAFVAAGVYRPEEELYVDSPHNVFTRDFKRFDNAEVRELSFVPLPHNERFELDLHRPYIDDFVLEKDGEEYKRTKEVMDVWLDSGAMPFAQDPSSVVYPADFISEAIDQTRGWFYTLHAVGSIMGRGVAYKNVICLGHLLDKDGKKMSKSIGNVVNPWEMIESHGVDALRLWMYSVNQPGEPKNFDEATVVEVSRKFLNIFENTLSFYELYRDKELEVGLSKFESTNILDKWIESRLNQLIASTTDNLDSYKLLEPVRAIRDFLDDLSTWYLRRSRERIKEGDSEAKKTLYLVLKNVSKLMAPFAPFIAEDIYQKLRTETDPESVHLETWSEAGDIDDNIVSKMWKTRNIVSLLLEIRSTAGIKVRQPLASAKAPINLIFPELIKDEINVKEVIDSEVLEIDTNLTPELLEEGRVRELIRSIQDMRKEKNLSPQDKMSYSVPEELKEIFAKYEAEIKKATNIEI